MTVKPCLLGLVAVLWAWPVHADLPDYVLERDYRNCLSGDRDPRRAIYCGCIRDGMKGWDEETYVRVVMQIAQASGKANAPTPSELQGLARQCLSGAFQ